MIRRVTLVVATLALPTAGSAGAAPGFALAARNLRRSLIEETSP